MIYNDGSLNASFIFKGNSSSKAGYNMAALHMRITLIVKAIFNSDTIPNLERFALLILILFT